MVHKSEEETIKLSPVTKMIENSMQIVHKKHASGSQMLLKKFKELFYFTLKVFQRSVIFKIHESSY